MTGHLLAKDRLAGKQMRGLYSMDVDQRMKKNGRSWDAHAAFVAQFKDSS